MCHSSARARGCRRNGIALIYVTVVLTLLFAMASFAVDYGIISLARAELRDAVDAACLAGGSGISISPAEARSRAKACALANTVNGRPLVLLDSDIELGEWDSSARKFTVLTGSDESKAHTLRITGRKSTARNSAVDLVFSR